MRLKEDNFYYNNFYYNKNNQNIFLLNLCNNLLNCNLRNVHIFLNNNFKERKPIYTFVIAGGYSSLPLIFIEKSITTIFTNGYLLDNH